MTATTKKPDQAGAGKESDDRELDEALDEFVPGKRSAVHEPHLDRGAQSPGLEGDRGGAQSRR